MSSSSGLANSPAVPDREVHDRIIRYLADASQRQAGSPYPIAPSEASKAERFARFLARRYYRDRLHRSFRYSRLVAPTIIAEQVVETAEFDAFLAECSLGSLESARRVQELVLRHLNSTANSPPWWPELLAYECAFFLQAATSDPGPQGSAPRRGHSALCLELDWDIPAITKLLVAEQPVDDACRRPLHLIFSRTPEGRIYVAEVDVTTAAIFRALEPGVETAQAAAVTDQVARETVMRLAAIGAVVIKNPA